LSAFGLSFSLTPYAGQADPVVPAGLANGGLRPETDVSGCILKAIGRAWYCLSIQPLLGHIKTLLAGRILPSLAQHNLSQRQRFRVRGFALIMLIVAYLNDARSDLLKAVSVEQQPWVPCPTFLF
jgi:hypothetical protein